MQLSRCRDSIAFLDDPGLNRCSDVGSYLAANEVYSQNCMSLQERLFDTCCEAVTETTERRAGSATIVGSTLGAFFGIGLVVVFLMKRFSSNPKPYRPSPLMPLPKDDTESISPSTNTAPPPYQPLTFEHPPAAPTIVVRPPVNEPKAEESGPIYESSVYYEKGDTESISPSTNTAPPPYQPLTFEHPPAAPTIVVRTPVDEPKAEESGPIYESSVYYETKSIETPVARLVVPCISEPHGYYSEQPPPYASK
jgi:hypothetical protein